MLHHHPVALLGYIGLLEGFPPSPGMIEDLRARTGYPADAFRTMVAHAELDPRHGDELFELVDTLPLTPEQSAVMGLSAMHSVADVHARARGRHRRGRGRLRLRAGRHIRGGGRSPP